MEETSFARVYLCVTVLSRLLSTILSLSLSSLKNENLYSKEYPHPSDDTLVKILVSV